ncbi:protein max-like isoform X1 [Dermacentor albipictus]|uniref:protein max-like isoform X1 n=1 Tax=Dermacentor albipictus TaxID=60249 RepID=UPI0038FC6576
MPFRGHSLAIRTNQKDSSFKDSFLSDDASLPEQRTSLDADKRAHHNALERRRRDHIKFSFTSLRDAVPSLQGEKANCPKTGNKGRSFQSTNQASRAQILKKAADYIQSMRRKNTAHLQDIEDLKRQNKLLEEQMSERRRLSCLAVRALEKTKVAGGGGYSTAPMLDAMNIKGDSISAFDGGSGSESSDDTDNSSRGSRKKLKSSPGSTPLHL